MLAQRNRKKPLATGQKPSKYKSGSTDASKAAALDDTSVIIVGRIPSIFSLIETILLIIQVDGLEEAIAVVSSESLTGQKLSKYKTISRDTTKAAVLDYTSVTIVGRIP